LESTSKSKTITSIAAGTPGQIGRIGAEINERKDAEKEESMKAVFAESMRNGQFQRIEAKDRRNS
jgi:hypothetical protein